jgi:hypothetical protein
MLPFNFKVDRLQNADVQTVAVDANSRKEICGKMKLGDFKSQQEQHVFASPTADQEICVF